MMNTRISPQNVATSITKAASQQTYYTIRFLVDRERVADAYRAYAYFRWVDDTLDEDSALPKSTGTVVSGGSGREASRPEAEAHERINFLERQKSLLGNCYRGEVIQDATPEEKMLVELVQQDHEKNSGLQSYLRNMMQVMDFDARRRGRLISYAELNQYTRWLATAVTEAMHYFIGHGCASPHDETRYLAVSGAHIAHMLRDTYDDVRGGYYNIPREILEASHIQPDDIQHEAYCAWVRSRVQLAWQYFGAGRKYLAQVQERRCRLAGFAYTARFEWLLDTIERENYSLRPKYSERKSPVTGMRMGWSTLLSLIALKRKVTLASPAVPGTLRKL
jgi:phytoene/squalene synthetase